MFTADPYFLKTIYSSKYLQYTRQFNRIKDELDSFFNQLNSELHNKSIKDISIDLLEEMYILRVSVLNMLFENNGELFSLLESFSISHEWDSEASKFYEDVLEIHFKITNNTILNESSNSYPQHKPTNDSQAYCQFTTSYNFFEEFSKHPNPQFRAIKDWIDASLRFEIGLIIAYLFLDDRLKIPPTSDRDSFQKELSKFIKNELELYGAYSIFTGFWSPSDEDGEIQLIRNMEIVASSLYVDHKIGLKSMSLEAFKKHVETA